MVETDQDLFMYLSNASNSSYTTIIGGSNCIVNGDHNVVINCTNINLNATGAVMINCQNLDITDDCSIWINNSKVENGAGLSFFLREFLQEQILEEEF